MSAVLSWRYCYERTQRGALGLCAYVHTNVINIPSLCYVLTAVPPCHIFSRTGREDRRPWYCKLAAYNGVVSCKLLVRLLRRMLLSDNTASAGMLCQLARRLSSGSSVPRQPFVRLWRPRCGCQHSDCNRCSPVLRQLSAALQGGKTRTCLLHGRSQLLQEQRPEHLQ